jgi:ABC-type polysaccharide/polyol phosphate export permease
VKYLFEVAISVWMFATSVVFPIELVGGRTGQVMRLNPMTPIIEAYRDVLLRNRVPSEPAFLVVALIAVVGLMLAWLLFHRAEFTFAENV